MKVDKRQPGTKDSKSSTQKKNVTIVINRCGHLCIMPRFLEWPRFSECMIINAQKRSFTCMECLECEPEPHKLAHTHPTCINHIR